MFPTDPARRRSRALLLALPAVTLLALATWAASTPNLPRALESQRALVARTPSNPALRVDFANLLQLDGRFDEAEAQYREAIELDDQHVAAHFNLGLLLQAQDKERSALGEFKRVVDIEPRHAWAHYQIGSVLESQGRETAAVHAYARAFALEPRLRFPDVNPHVIENRLLTLATLEAYRRRDELVKVPRTYEDARRISSLLYDPSASDATAASAQEKAAPGTPVTPAPPPPTGRVIGAQDVVPGSNSGMVGVGGAQAPSRLYQTPHYQPAPIVDEGQGYDVEGGDPQPGSPLVPGAAFVPGTDSSGRLEMRRPVANPSRIASASGGREARS